MARTFTGRVATCARCRQCQGGSKEELEASEPRPELKAWSVFSLERTDPRGMKWCSSKTQGKAEGERVPTWCSKISFKFLPIQPVLQFHDYGHGQNRMK